MANKRQHAAAIKAALGSEPLVDKLDPSAENYIHEFMNITNWYSYEKGRKDAYKYLTEYVRKFRSTDLKVFASVDEKDIMWTYGWMARMQSRGAKLSEDHIRRFNNYIDSLLQVAKQRIANAPVVTEEKEVRPSISIQEAMQEKIAEYIGELETELDDFMFSDKDLNLYNYMKARQTPAAYVPEIESWAKGKLSVWIEVIRGEDEQLVEGYSNFDKRKQKAIGKALAQFIEDCQNYTQYKKANKKPRAVREKPASAQVKGIKYKPKDEELNLESQKPTDLIGAEQVWLYNTKTKKLSVYVSESVKGMSAKGTSLQNWVPEKSKQKTLRKPAEQIKELMASGKVKLRTFLDSVTTKEQPVNGRINTDTIILRIIK
jgi:hypothetical protein